MNDKECEDDVLRTIISFPQTIYRILKFLKKDVFYDPINKRVIEAILSLLDEGIVWDGTLVSIRLKKLTGTLGIQDIIDLLGGGNPVGIEEKYFYLLELYIKREHTRISNKAIQLALDPTTDALDNQELVLKELQALEGLITKDSNSSLDEVLQRTFSDMTDRQEGKVIPYWKTNWKILDNILQISPGNILLLGGKGGSSKTKFIIAMMKRMFSNNDNISCQWYSMEDPADKIIRAWIAQETKLTDSILQSKQRNLTQTELERAIALRDKFASWDIEYVEKSTTIKSMRGNFKAFCARRPDNLNILIIDNLMILDDNNRRGNQTEIDDEIARGIQTIMRETSGYVIAVHHFTDAQLDKLNFSSGYRPRESHLKGSTRYRDIATQVMLINRPAQYGDIVEYYKGRDYINHLLITEVTKNRNNATGIIRWFASPETNTFLEL